MTHWRTYSDMANSRHDESTAYERGGGRNASISGKSEGRNSNSGKDGGRKSADYSNCYGSLKYYDIYPLSREMKEQLYKTITPSGNARTGKGGQEEQEEEEAGVNLTTSTSDTYEPIEAYCCK